MPETRRRYDPDFRDGAVRVVRETHKPIARDLGINPGTVGTWVARDKAASGGDDSLTVADQARLRQLEREVTEPRMERDVLKRCVALWVKEATR